MTELKAFIVHYNGKFIRAYEQKAVDKLLATNFKEPSTNNMFEIKINERLYIFNKTSITYILLGDGSVSSDTALRVIITLNNGDMKQFCFDNHESAQKLYNEIKRLVLSTK